MAKPGEAGAGISEPVSCKTGWQSRGDGGTKLLLLTGTECPILTCHKNMFRVKFEVRMLGKLILNYRPGVSTRVIAY